MTSPVFDPGNVRVASRQRDGQNNVSIRVVRPNASAVLRGRRADEAVRLLPMLYAICGVAQGAAARLALAAARGAACETEVDADVLAEAQREHLWRLLLDWPSALGLARREALFVAGRKALQESLFPSWAAQTLRLPCAELEAAMRDLPQPRLPQDTLLPVLDAAETVALWPRLDAAFAAAPEYRGGPASTGALVRHPELAGLGALNRRVMARAADLFEPVGLGRVSASAVAPGIGRATVETARGLLLHEIVLDGDVVADYVIVAPTEWNFHPAGQLKEWLEGVAADELEAVAARAILACDPCVPWKFEVE